MKNDEEEKQEKKRETIKNINKFMFLMVMFRTEAVSF